jgi:prefoldin subunit 5
MSAVDTRPVLDEIEDLSAQIERMQQRLAELRERAQREIRTEAQR